MSAPVVELDTDVAECGDVVSGRVSWGPVDKTPRQVVVELIYETSGRGDTDSEAVSEHVVAGADSGETRFTLSVPDDGPITFDGSLIRVAWRVEAKLDQAMQRDQRGSTAVTVLPAGGLALWARQVAPPPTVGPIGGSDAVPHDAGFEDPPPS